MKELARRVVRWFLAGQIRITIRAVFSVFLCVAIGLPLWTISTQKKRSDADHKKARDVTEQRIVDRLQSPAGQLVLRNPSRLQEPATPLRPVILPFGEIQADIPGVVLDQVRAIGCPIQFKATQDAELEQGTICVGLRNGDEQEVRGRLLVTGTFVAKRLVPHIFLEARAEEAGRPVAKRFQDAHRIEVSLHDSAATNEWVLPVQVRIDPKTRRVRDDLGLTAYRKDSRGVPITAKPDFTGAWLTEGDCIDSTGEVETCNREHSFSIAIPRDRWERLNGHVVPAELTLDVAVLGPNVDGKPETILNSKLANTAFVPFGKADLESYLAPGESLMVRRRLPGKPQVLFSVARGQESKPDGLQSIGERVLRLLGADLTGIDSVLEQKRTFTVRGGTFELLYRSSARGMDPELVGSAAAVTAYALLMIFMTAAAWYTFERGVMTRVKRLTGRTRLVSDAIRKAGSMQQFDYSELKGRDELGVLATGLDDLVKRIGEDARRSTARNETDQSILRAIGHEIRGPLQSLSAVLAGSEPGSSYVRRMLMAVAALYGSASPTSGIESSEMDVELMDLADFLVKLTNNAHHAAIDNVVYTGAKSGVFVRADQAALETAISHVLRNAKRYRPAGTPIAIALSVKGGAASISIRNGGPPIPLNLIDRIFDYGVSESRDESEGSHGQGLFVSMTYVAKMGGRISAKNLDVGVEFLIELPVTNF